MRRRKPDEWTIVIDSLPGFVTGAFEDTVEEVIDAANELRDPAFGIDDRGVLSVSFDVEAADFGEAVERAVDLLTSAFARHGIDFPLDSTTLPRRSG